MLHTRHDRGVTPCCGHHSRSAAKSRIGAQVVGPSYRDLPNLKRSACVFVALREANMGLQVVRKGSRGRRSFTARFLLTILLLAPLAACRPHDGGGCASPPLPAGHWPQDCWHPFSNSSVFYSALPDRSVLVAHSQPALAGPAQHPPGNLAVSQTGAGPGEPVFYAHATDPEFTLNCVNDDPGRPDHGCPIDTSKTGLKLRVPAGATPESNLSIVVGQPRKYDAHMIIIDENAKWEYDLWQVQSTSSWQQVQSNGLVVKGLDPAGGKIDFSWGGR